jgi:hypothetical protein
VQQKQEYENATRFDVCGTNTISSFPLLPSPPFSLRYSLLPFYLSPFSLLPFSLSMKMQQGLEVVEPIALPVSLFVGFLFFLSFFPFSLLYSSFLSSPYPLFYHWQLKKTAAEKRAIKMQQGLEAMEQKLWLILFSISFLLSPLYCLPFLSPPLSPVLVSLPVPLSLPSPLRFLLQLKAQKNCSRKKSH